MHATLAFPLGLLTKVIPSGKFVYLLCSFQDFTGRWADYIISLQPQMVTLRLQMEMATIQAGPGFVTP